MQPKITVRRDRSFLWWYVNYWPTCCVRYTWPSVTRPCHVKFKLWPKSLMKGCYQRSAWGFVLSDYWMWGFHLRHYWVVMIRLLMMITSSPYVRQTDVGPNLTLHNPEQFVNPTRPLTWSQEIRKSLVTIYCYFLSLGRCEMWPGGRPASDWPAESVLDWSLCSLSSPLSIHVVIFISSSPPRRINRRQKTLNISWKSLLMIETILKKIWDSDN